jgi:hypothetical protein
MPTIAATFNEANSNAVCLARQLERYSKFETTHAMAAWRYVWRKING